VVAEAENGRQALAQFRKALPDVTLLDIRMPDMSGVETLKAIREADSRRSNSRFAVLAPPHCAVT
jgi:YesN/AraC family two-component response regulator